MSSYRGLGVLREWKRREARDGVDLGIVCVWRGGGIISPALKSQAARSRLFQFATSSRARQPPAKEHLPKIRSDREQRKSPPRDVGSRVVKRRILGHARRMFSGKAELHKRLSEKPGFILIGCTECAEPHKKTVSTKTLRLFGDSRGGTPRWKRSTRSSTTFLPVDRLE